MHLRGSQTSFKEIFFDEPQAPVISISKNQGRNQDLNQRRNECLVERYYFIARKNEKWAYEETVKEVASQFFLSPFHASKVILGQHTRLTALKMQWKSEPVDKIQKHLMRKWPHLVWA